MDFEGGQCQIVPGNWLTVDKKLCSWPPWAEDIPDQLEWDKVVREENEPQSDWTEVKVLRQRVSGSNFQYVRGKLKMAEDLSATDLATDYDSGRRRPSEKSKPPTSPPPFPKTKLVKADHNKHGRSSAKSSKSSSGVQSESGCSSPQTPDHSRLNSVAVMVPGSAENREQSPRTAVLSERRFNENPIKGSIKSFGTKLVKADHNKLGRSSAKSSSGVQSESGCSPQTPDHSRLNSVPVMVPGSAENREQSPRTSVLSERCFNVNPIKGSFKSFGNVEDADLIPFKRSKGDSVFSPRRFNSGKENSSGSSSPLLQKTPSLKPDSGKVSIPKGHNSKQLGSNSLPRKSPLIGLTDTDERTERESKPRPTRQKTPSGTGILSCPSIEGASKSDSFKDKAMTMAEEMTDLEFKAYIISSLSQLKSKIFSGAPIAKRSLHVNEEDTDALKGLPANSMLEWEDFEKKLGAKEFASAVVSDLTAVGKGNDDIRGAVRAILGRVLSNRVASKFSFSGARIKIGLKKSAFYQSILLRVIKKLYPEYSILDVKKASENWLRLANQRKGGEAFNVYKKKKTAETDDTPQAIMDEERVDDVIQMANDSGTAEMVNNNSLSNSNCESDDESFRDEASGASMDEDGVF